MNEDRKEEVERELRRGRSKDRSGELIEEDLGNEEKNRGDDICEDNDVIVKSLEEKIEEEVFKENILRIVRIEEKRKRKLIRRRKKLDLGWEDLELEGRKVSIERIVGERIKLKIEEDEKIEEKGLGKIERGRIRIGKNMGNEVMIEKIDEENEEMVKEEVKKEGKKEIRKKVSIEKGWEGMDEVKVNDLWILE